MKKVSVIIPVYNSEAYLKECIDSVINQTYTNLEIIIINDASTDNSLDIIKQYKDNRIKLINLEKNIGVSKARNKGIDTATGDYICFIDSDDYWYDFKIKKQIDFIEKKNCEFIYSNYYFKKNDKLHKTNVPATINYDMALGNTTIFISTVMLNMNKLKKEDIYMPEFKLGQDTACWWQILKKINKAYGMEDVLAVYRVRKNSLSSNKLKAIIGTWKLYKNENLKFNQKIKYFSKYILNAIKRRV